MSLNAITRLQAKAFTQELRKREKEGHAGTSQSPKPQNNPTKKKPIKVGKGKEKVIVQSGYDEDTTTVAISESSKSKSSKGGNGDGGQKTEKETREPRPKTPSGLHEYPNPIQEKENLVKAKALVEECQATRVEPKMLAGTEFPRHQMYPTPRAQVKVSSTIAELNED